jgi:hypothetical protein
VAPRRKTGELIFGKAHAIPVPAGEKPIKTTSGEAAFKIL